jgi:hypothetical protein
MNNRGDIFMLEINPNCGVFNGIDDPACADGASSCYGEDVFYCHEEGLFDVAFLGWGCIRQQPS